MTKAVALVANAGAGPAAGPSSNGADQRAHAKLKMYEPPEAPGVPPTTKVGEIAFQFNPNQVTISKSADWKWDKVKTATTTGPAEFLGVGRCTLKLEMFFDATSTHDGSVVAAVESLLRCCKPTQKSIVNKSPAPIAVVFEWGDIMSFPACVTSVSAAYSLFTATGMPIRATCGVSLEELPVEPQKTNPTSGSRTVRRVHTIVEGDSLASVAYREYGDAQLWRPLAVYNGVDDPMALTQGQPVLVPAVEDLLAAGWDR